LLIKWANERLLHHGMSGVARRIYSKYWRKFAAQSDAIAQLLLVGYCRTLNEFSNPFSERDYSEGSRGGELCAEEFKGNRAARFRVLKLLVETKDHDLGKMPITIGSNYQLYDEEDFSWILAQVQSATNQPVESRWMICLRSLMRLEVVEQNIEILNHLHGEKPHLLDKPEAILDDMRVSRAKSEQSSKEWNAKQEERNQQGIKNQAEIEKNIKKLLNSGNTQANHFMWLSVMLFAENGSSSPTTIDITASTGWGKLEEAEKAALILLAEEYLRVGDIPVTERRSFNLYAASALYLLYKCSNASFLKLGKEVWARAAEAFIKVNSFDKSGCLEPLLDRFVVASPEMACDTIIKLTLQETEDKVCSTLSLWGKRLTASQAKAVIDASREAGLPIEAHFMVLEAIAKLSHESMAEETIEAMIDLESSTPPDLSLSDHLALGYRLDPTRYCEKIIDWIESNNEWGKRWVQSVVGFMDSSLQTGILNSPVKVIQRFYIWLHTNYPYSDKPESDGSGHVSSIDSTYQLKTTLIGYLENSGLSDATECFREIFQKFPEDEWLKDCIIKAHRNECSSSLSPLSISEIQAIIASGKEKRLIVSSHDLLECVLEWLEGYQARLQGDNPAVADIWNTQKPIKPRDEEYLSDHLARYLGDIRPLRSTCCLEACILSLVKSNG